MGRLSRFPSLICLSALAGALLLVAPAPAQKETAHKKPPGTSPVLEGLQVMAIDAPARAIVRRHSAEGRHGLMQVVSPGDQLPPGLLSDGNASPIEILAITADKVIAEYVGRRSGENEPTRMKVWIHLAADTHTPSRVTHLDPTRPVDPPAMRPIFLPPGPLPPEEQRGTRVLPETGEPDAAQSRREKP